jgi:hypothetical protein
MSTPLDPKDNKLSIEAVKADSPKKVRVLPQKEQEVLSIVFNKFRAAADNRNRQFKFFDNRNLIEYIEDSVGRFMTNLDERDGIEDWQARINVPMTHNKVTAILAKIVNVLPQAEIRPRLDNGNKKAEVLDILYKYAEDVDDYEELMICAALEALLKGTVIGYEGHTYSQFMQRDIVGTEDDGSPKVKSVPVGKSKLFGAIVPLEEFYPSSISIRRVDDMPYAFRRFVVSYAEFIDQFQCFERHELVDPVMMPNGEAAVEDNPFYRDYISMDIEDGNVEVIEYYNRQTDEYVIIANGVWLNPMKGYVVAPNPFGHKRLPFWSARFDTNASDFFYGKSLADRLSSMQDVLNVLTNMLLDQSFLTIFPPILTAGIDPLEEDYLRPGRRVPVDTQGLPLQQSFMKLDLGTPSGWHQFILEYTGKIMEQASVDQVASGQAGVGGRTTAEEIRQAASSVSAIIGIFGRLLNTGIKHKAMLKASNILQFWTDPKTPIAGRVLGTKGDIFNEAFNVVSVDNARLSSGKRGKKIIAMYESAGDLPSPKALRTREKLYQMETGNSVQIVAVTPEYLRDLDFDIKIVMGELSQETKDMQKALVLEKVRVYSALFPDLINKMELANQVAEAMGDNPEQVFKQQEVAPPQAAPGMPGTSMGPEMGGAGVPAMSPPSVEPQGDVAGNMLRGMQGGNPAAEAFNGAQ